MSDRVVVGYDGGPNGADALDFAADWARKTGDEIVVATVHPGPAPIGPQHVDAEWAADERAQAEHLLEQARSHLGAIPATYRRIEADSPARALHELAEEEPDFRPLIVIGGRRSGPKRRTAPGSTAHRLLSGTSAPIALIPHDYDDVAHRPMDRLVLGYVDTRDGNVALDHGITMAKKLGAMMRIVCVVPDTRVRPTLGEPGIYAEERWGDYHRNLDRATARARDAGLEVEGELITGDAHKVLADIGRDRGDILVIGSRCYGPVRSVLLGGVSSRVVRSALLPVIVVPRGD